MYKIVVVCLVWMCLLADANADHFDIHLFAGQSNAQGAGHVLHWLKWIPKSNNEVLYSHDTYSNNQESWGPTRMRRGNYGSIRRWYGPEMTYSFIVGADENQAILKFARGGTSLALDWAPRAATRLQFFNYVDQQLQELENRGHSWSIQTMVWIQGEADASNLANAEAYDIRLLNLTDSVRARYSAPNMTVRLLLLHPDLDRPFVAEMRESQLRYLLLDPLATLADIDDQNLKSDNVHFTSSAAQAAGVRLALTPPPIGRISFLASRMKRYYRSR